MELIIQSGQIVNDTSALLDQIIDLSLQFCLRQRGSPFDIILIIKLLHTQVRQLLCHHGTQLGVAVISHIKIRKFIVQSVSNACQIDLFAVILVNQGENRLPHLLNGGHILLLRSLKILIALQRFILLCYEVQMYKFVTGSRQCKRRLRLAHAQNKHILLPQTHGKSGKITVARHQTEALYLVLIENIHRVDDHRHIRRILPCRIRELLYRHDRIFQ